MALSIIRTSIYMYYSILYFFMRIAFLMGLYIPNKQETFLDAHHKYILPLKNRFLTIFENDEKNINIDPIFYDKKEHAKCVMESENHLEKIWKTRILFENTPRGNIIMYYDAYKLGFSFFCDQNVVSYDILNAVAMKYVRLFNCCDFFIDELITPIEKPSPFIKFHFTEDEKKKKDSENKIDNKSNTNSAFVKLRNYSKENPNEKKQIVAAQPFLQFFSSKKEPDVKMNPNEPEKMKNKFIYLGKIHNFKMTQYVPKKRRVLAKFTSPLLESVRIDSNVQRERLSYKDFKKSVKPEATLQ